MIIGTAAFLVGAHVSASDVLAFVIGVLFSAALRDDVPPPRRRHRRGRPR
jgi:hypothetical protein